MTPAVSSRPAHADTLIEGAVVTMDGERRVFTDGAVAVTGDRIVAVGTRAEVSRAFVAEQRLGGRRRFVIPGMVDTHNHLAQSLMRELAIEDHMNIPRVYVRAEEIMTPDEVRVNARFGIAQLLRAGVTTTAETTGTREHEEIIAREIMSSGIRCAMARGQGDRVSTFVGTPAQIASRSVAHDDPGKRREDEAETRAFLERWREAGQGRLRPWIHAGSVASCSDERFLVLQALGSEFGTGVVHHLNRDRDEIELSLALTGRRPIEHLHAIGGLSASVLCVHAMLASDREIQMLVESGAAVAHAPIVSADILSAVARVPAMRAAGVTVGLACDTVINDILSVMRVAIVTHAQQTGTALYDAWSFTAEDAFTMGTIEGARALLWADQIGSLEVGKAADIVVVDGDNVRLSPAHNPVAVLARYATGTDVESVLVGGKLVVADGQVTTIDEAGVLDEAEGVSQRLRETIEAARYGPFVRRP